MAHLRRFWFEFEQIPRPTAVNLGCGVTAYSREDALALVRERVFGANGPALVRVIDDVTPDQLETNHVLPNLGNVVQRGIWFPQGYDEPLE